MADFSFITRRLATGAAVTNADDVAQMKASGITHCIDCRVEFVDTPLLRTSGLIYLWNGTADDGQPKPPEWFQKSIDFALAALAHPATKVYAHCAAGVNRGPSTAYAILRAFGLGPESAETAIRTKRKQVGLAYKADADRAVLALGYDF